jgi:hypothetical protein
MSNFSQEISDFQHYGTYDYRFDNVGNLTFNSSSAMFNQVFLALPLLNVDYNNTKIQSFYNVQFEEFIPQVEITASLSSSADVLQTQLQTAQQENISLQSQLNDFILQSQVSSSADVQATQQVILELRKALGQGRVDSDFSTTFPYTPINKPTI